MISFPGGMGMKKLWLLMIALLLCGCSAEQTFETVEDEIVIQASAQPREILLTLPEETLLPAMETDEGMLYLCDGYDVAVQIFSAGDLDATLRQLSGFEAQELTIMETQAGACRCYEFTWTMATGLGEQVGRAMILDDGNYHYAVTATAPAEKAQDYREIWNGLFETVAIS